MSGCEESGHGSSGRRLQGSKSLTHDVHVLLRHRLLLQAHGFEGFGCDRSSSERTIVPSRSVQTTCARVSTLDAALAAPVLSRRDHESPASRNSSTFSKVATMLQPVFERALLHRRRGRGRACLERRVADIDSTSGVHSCERRHRRARECGERPRTISTFSCDIAYSASPTALRACRVEEDCGSRRSCRRASRRRSQSASST